MELGVLGQLHQLKAEQQGSQPLYAVLFDLSVGLPQEVLVGRQSLLYDVVGALHHHQSRLVVVLQYDCHAFPIGVELKQVEYLELEQPAAVEYYPLRERLALVCPAEPASSIHQSDFVGGATLVLYPVSRLSHCPRVQYALVAHAHAEQEELYQLTLTADTEALGQHLLLELNWLIQLLNHSPILSYLGRLEDPLQTVLL